MAPPDEGEPRIGMNVRAARRSRGMSLETLAGLTGRSKGWLSKIENGRARLERRQDIAASAEALEVSADTIVGAPAPEIQPHARSYNFRPIRAALLDATIDDRGTCQRGLSVSWRNSQSIRTPPCGTANTAR